jgi:hypothetical protein
MEKNMMKPKIPFFLIIIAIVSSSYPSNRYKDKYVINPVSTNFDSFPPISSNLRYYVSYNEGPSSPFDSIPCGFTRISIKKNAPIYCSPTISNAVKKSIESLFIRNKINSNDPTSANFVVKIKILHFSIEEKSYTFYQTMDCHLKFEVSFIDPFSTDHHTSFIVESSNSKTALDTSKHAENIIQGTIKNALLEISKSLKQ